MIKGRIHSIETMGTLDGPGIRYLVFMQGCPLRCIYCHNRDTWNINNGKEITVNEIIEDLKKYKHFIQSSNGGITITGGEPTLQANFVTEIFKKCKELGIHTALDTSGFVDISKVEQLLKYTDLVLLDIKHGTAEKHKEITGVSNKKIIEFGKYASGMGIDIWVRYVLIPGYTDSKEDLDSAKEFIKQLKTIKKIEVLPYHKMGEYKWTNLDKKYILKDVQEPTKEQVKNAQQYLESIS